MINLGILEKDCKKLFAVDINTCLPNRVLGPRYNEKTQKRFFLKQASEKICKSKLFERRILIYFNILLLTLLRYK